MSLIILFLNIGKNMIQSDIMGDILNLYREIEKSQKEINELVLKNREMVKNYKDFDEDYTGAIESYYQTN